MSQRGSVQIILFVLGIIVISGMIVGGGLYVKQRRVQPATVKQVQSPIPVITNSSPKVVAQPIQATQAAQPAQQTQLQSPEIVFADKLSSCTSYKTTFKHLFTGDMLEKEIVGMIGGKCNYHEQMPNGGKMECNYIESERVAVAQYYKDIASAQSFGTSLQVTDQGRKTKYTIDGKEVENPLEEAINSGACVVTGY
jgi:hypothetical protein